MRAKYDLLIGLNSAIKALGYEIEGLNTFPRVEVHSLIETPGTSKDNDMYEVTGVMDVITQSETMDDAESITNIIVTNINDTLLLDNYNVSIFVWESSEDIEEIGSTEDTIFRLFTRFRTLLIKK